MSDLVPQDSTKLARGATLPSANAPIIRFELTEDLGGSETEAKWVRWDATEEDYVVTSHVISVVDFLGIFSGQSGDRGYARWWSDRRAYEIFLMECP